MIRLAIGLEATHGLYVLGDLVDRGPDGIGVIELLMRLQRQAPDDGGPDEVVIGNHDIVLLGACKFGERCRQDWLDSGGVVSDLERLTDRPVNWLCVLPAMRLERDVLMQHADALFDREYGSTPDAGCLNVDPGIYLGGRGFAYKVSI